MGKGFAKKKKQAKAMQEKIAKLQEEMENIEYEGSAGNGLVVVKMKGSHELVSIKIKPDCVDPEDIEGLEALICAAFKDATSKMGPGGHPDMSSMPGMEMLKSMNLDLGL